MVFLIIMHNIMSPLKTVSGKNWLIASELQDRAAIIAIKEERQIWQGKSFKRNGQKWCNRVGTIQQEENKFENPV